MRPLNYLDSIVEILTNPFDSFHPFLPLSILCFFTSLIGMYFYKRLTDQGNLKTIHKNIELVHLEIKIRSSNFTELLQLLGKSIGWNLLYLKSSILPSLIIIIPLIGLLFPIEAYFSYYPIRVGNNFSSEIIQKAIGSEVQTIKLFEVPNGLELIESERVYGVKVIHGWYFRAKRNGIYNLKFHFKDGVITKRVVVSDSIQRINPILRPFNWLQYIYSLEEPISERSRVIESISVSYEKVTLPIANLGISLNWFSYFILIFLIIFLIAKSFMKVY